MGNNKILIHCCILLHFSLWTVGTLYENQYTIFITSRSVLLRMKIFSYRSCRGNQNTTFMIDNFFFFRKSCRLRDEKMQKSVVERGRPQMTIWRERIACWILTARNTHRLSNTCCLSTATKVVGTRLNVTVHVHCLSCIFIVQITIHHKSSSSIQKWTYSCNLYILSDLCLDRLEFLILH